MFVYVKIVHTRKTISKRDREREIQRLSFEKEKIKIQPLAKVIILILIHFRYSINGNKISSK